MTLTQGDAELKLKLYGTGFSQRELRNYEGPARHPRKAVSSEDDMVHKKWLRLLKQSRLVAKRSAAI